MKITSEWDLLNKIKKRIPSSPARLILGIGDDCAVFEKNDSTYGLITTDMSVEHVHFRQDLSSPEDIGFKIMTANVSDIAAMGGSPLFAFVSLGIPTLCSEEYILRVYDGMLEGAQLYQAHIAGGDISKAAEIVINIALYGEVPKDKLVRRNGARPGDIIYMTGSTGGSLAGLELLKSGKRDIYPSLIKKHCRPLARSPQVAEIVRLFSPTAMLDISDGLLADLGHISDQGNCGFLLYEEKLPVSEDLSAYCTSIDKSPLDYLLTSGEEYELLFTSSNANPEAIAGIEINAIGEITPAGYMLKQGNGSLKPLKITGFDHFS